MVERAILQNIVPELEEGETEIQDPYFTCNWFSRHPGDEIEINLISLVEKLSNKGEKDVVYLSTFKGSYIFFRWIASVRGGLSIILPIFEDNNSLLTTSQWVKYLWEFQQADFSDFDALMSFHTSLAIDSIKVNDIPLSPVWLKASLSGDKIQIPKQNRDEFLSMLSLVIQNLPWSVYLLDRGTLSDDGFELKYKKAKGSIQFSMEELYSQLQLQDQEFWRKVHLGMTNITQLDPENRSNKMLTYLGLILYIQKDKPDSLESLNVIKEYVIDILTLGLDSGNRFITRTFSQVAVEHPNYETSKRLLNVADKIQNSNQSDLIKLAEGTALQIAFSLPDLKKREEIFLEVTQRSRKWGNSHLIAYIQSVTGILQETEENKAILSKIVASCENILNESWDGQLCLVETYLIANQINKAIKTRLEASNRLSDKIMRAEDIFGAMSWSLSQSTNEQDLIELSRDHLNQALLDIPKGQILLQQMEGLVNSCMETSKLHFLFNVINQVNAAQLGLELDDRMQMISLLEQLLSISKKYIQILIHVQLNRFNILVENPAVYSYDAAEDLLRSIYNSVDPSKPNSIELITHITNWIILSSTKANRLDMIDEARMRFNLLINDEEYSRVTLRDIFTKAGRIRQKIPKAQLKKNGIGVKLFNEAIELCHPFKETDFLLDVLPDAKLLAIKKQAYMAFVRFVILEITLLQHLEMDWMESSLESTDILVDNGALEASRELFDHAVSLDLDQEMTVQLLTKQLSYVEIEPDLFDAHEIYEKRNQLINLKSNFGDKKTQDELLDHYRFGVSELMSKGDIEHLSELVIQAIIYCINNKIGAVSEFSNILKDSFSNNVNTYQENKSSNVYKSLITLLRKLNNSFKMLDLDHIAQYSSILLRANLELYNTTKQSLYIQRSKTLIREIAGVIREGGRNNVEITPEVNEVLIFEVNSVLSAIEKTNNLFGKIDAVNLAAQFYYNIGDTNSLFSYLNDTLSHLKREIVKSKHSTSTIVVALLVLSEIYLKIEADFILELCIPLQQHALRLLDVILTIHMPKEFSVIINNLKDRMESSPQQAFQEYPFEIENMLQAIDGV